MHDMRNGISGRVGLVAFVFCVLAGMLIAQGNPEESGRARRSTDEDRQARHLYDKALELIEFKQYDRGLAMLNTLVRDYPGSLLAHQANMAMGKHFLEQGNPSEALQYFMLLTRLLAPQAGEPLSEELTELYHEALFQAGFSQYTAGQYSAAFPLFRRLTEVADKSRWANMAYFYIGMSHYNLKNWNKAIEALSLVGTSIEDSGDELGRIEIGQRFYAKIVDADIPILRRLGQPVRAEVRVSSGDFEILNGVPVAARENELLASAPTELGPPNPNDGTIQLVGGDTLTVTYLDDSTLDGRKAVPRTGQVRAVSTGTVGFFLGDFATPAYTAFSDQPLHLMLRDADLDVSAERETLQLTVRSFRRVDAKQTEENTDILDVFAMQDSEEDAWRERDAVVVTLTEQGTNAQVRTGVFTGRVKLAPMEPETVPDRSDDVLHCDELDEIRVSYSDAVHIYGDEERVSEALVKVSGSVNAGVTADQFVVFEALLRARKESVEAEALVGLAAIYKDMGLAERAAQEAAAALSRVNPIVENREMLPGDLVETAFRLKWESELLQDNFDAATATCLAFNQLYPESVLADQALMTLGRSLSEKGQYQEAVAVYGQVRMLRNPISAAEAQFRIGETLQRQAEEQAAAAGVTGSNWGRDGYNPVNELRRRMGPAIAAFREAYQNYPESSFAADALGRVIRYHVETEDFAQAAGLLESVFANYPDAAFLDEMLMHWSSVARKMGDTDLAIAKLRQLVFDYPGSSFVSEAQRRLTELESQSE